MIVYNMIPSGFNLTNTLFGFQESNTLVALTHNDSSLEDEELSALATHLRYRANILLQVEGLSTGYCKDVHGQVSCFPCLIYPLTPSPFKHLFLAIFALSVFTYQYLFVSCCT